MLRSYIVGNCLDRGVIFAMIDKHNSPADFDFSSDFVANIARFSGVHPGNLVSFLFASEPEVSLLEPSGRPLGVIVVKDGTHPADAPERVWASRRDLTARGGKTRMWRPVAYHARWQDGA